MAAKIEMKFQSLDDIFGIDPKGEINPNVKNQIMSIPLNDIHDFPNHPFKVLKNQDMDELVESIKTMGLLHSALVRKSPDGNGYQMIAGHRRKMAFEIAGYDDIPCIVTEMNDDEAILAMIDSNLQREKILPSEKAFSYKMKLEVMNRQGQRTDLTYSPLGNKLQGVKSSDILAKDIGESKNQIFRYIRLTELILPILDMVDAEKIGLRPAVELSYLTEDEQNILFETMEIDDCTPSLAQALSIKTLSQEKRLNSEEVITIMSERKPNQVEQFKIPSDRIKKYFPSGTTKESMQDIIVKALDYYAKALKAKSIDPR